MAKFSEMPAFKVSQWVDWANSHDWGSERDAFYDPSTGEVVTYGSEHNGGEYAEVEARHKTPREMRDWAGY